MEGKLYDEIYTYLVSHFTPGEEIPADVVVKRILAGGYVPQRYGYQNMREMFADLKKFLTVKNGADGRMSVIIKPDDAPKTYTGLDFYSSAKPQSAHPRRGSGEIGLLSGMSFDEEPPKREQALPEDYSKRLPENRKTVFSAEMKEPAPVSAKPVYKEPAKELPRYPQQSEPGELPTEVKQKIYAAVVMGLQLEKPLYMSTLSPVLRYAGVEHDKLGFLKSKNMLRRCDDFMDFEEVMMNGVPQTLVTVHRVPEWDALVPAPTVKKSSEQLDDAEKKRIYELLCAHMTIGEPLHMAAFSPILRTYGFDYRSYGFLKVKELAASLSDFLSLQEVMMNGVPQTLVTLHPYTEQKEAQAQQKPAAKEEPSRRELHQIAFLPPKILGVLSRMTGSPVWACETALEESYLAAKHAGELVTEQKFISRKGVISEQKENTVRFPLTLKTMRGDTLVGELHETGTPDGKPWFLAWVGSPSFVKTETEESAPANNTAAEQERVLTPVLSDCCALSDSVVRAAAFKAVHASEQQTRALIAQGYEKAYQNGEIIANGAEYSFDLGVQNAQGKPICVILSPNRIGEKPYYVRFVGVTAVQGEKKEKPSELSGSAMPTEQVRIDNAPLPKELSALAYLPVPVLSLLSHRLGLLQEGTENLLAESYRYAKEHALIARRPNEIRFPLTAQSLKGEEITVILSPSMSEQQAWFLQHFDAVQKEAVLAEKEPRALEQFAFLGDWDAQLRFLASTAAAERWSFAEENKTENLKYYIDGVFDRIMAQDKLVYNAAKSLCIFHTGLSSRYGYDIYAQFSANLPGSKLPWRFERFVIGKYDAQFVGMPLAASYFDARFIPWFETERNMLLPEGSLILESLEILPLELLRRNSGALEISLIEQMKADANKMAGGYARLRACYKENPAQLELMASTLQRAIGYALHRSKRDYLYAVAGYLPQIDTPVWMLPLYLQRGNQPDAVVAFASEYGSYRPVKLLDCKEAYLAARFVRRIEGFWLHENMFDTMKE